MKLKKGVILAGLNVNMRTVLIHAESIWKKYKGYKKSGCVVTAGLDGLHSAGSVHYYGRALDFRVWWLSKDQVNKIARGLRDRLNPNYDVIIHKTHIHVEWDPK